MAAYWSLAKVDVHQYPDRPAAAVFVAERLQAAVKSSVRSHVTELHRGGEGQEFMTRLRFSSQLRRSDFTGKHSRVKASEIFAVRHPFTELWGRLAKVARCTIQPVLANVFRKRHKETWPCVPSPLRVSQAANEAEPLAKSCRCRRWCIRDYCTRSLFFLNLNSFCSRLTRKVRVHFVVSVSSLLEFIR